MAFPAARFFLLLGFLYERYGTYDIAGVRRDGREAAVDGDDVCDYIAVAGWAADAEWIRRRVPGAERKLSRVMRGWTAAATIGVILSAAYMLWMVQRRVLWSGVADGDERRLSRIVTWRERLRFGPMAVLMLVMGVASPYWIRAIDGQVTALVGSADEMHTHIDG